MICIIACDFVVEFIVPFLIGVIWMQLQMGF